MSADVTAAIAEAALRTIADLVYARLFDESSVRGVMVVPDESIGFVLTRTGRTFLEYSRG
jgi:hypothetical protein